MRQLISSMLRFSASVTMFSIEQVQSVAGAPADTKAAITKVRNALDVVSESLVSKMDDSKRAALDSLTKAQDEILIGAFEAVSLDTAGEFMQKTSETFSSAMGRST
jgi:hypothetical protein